MNGRCVAVEVLTKSSADVAAALSPAWDSRRDGARPDVWAPDSTSWLRVASARPDAAALLPAQPPSLARSPVVIAMPKPMAQALRWPHTDIGWRDLITTFTGNRGWARFGHPEWGRFQVGMTDPTQSTAGLQALLSITDFNNDEQINDDEIRSSLTLQNAITRYTPDTDGLFHDLQLADNVGKAMAYVSAFPALERDVSDYNAAGPKVPLAALYPPEGAADADHPYAILHASWVDPLRQAIAEKFLRYARGAEGRTAYSEAGFRGADRSPGPLLTRERGFLPIVDSPARMVAPPDSVTRAVVSWNAVRRKSNILAVIDVSGSMATPVPGTNQTKLQLAQSAARRAVKLFNNETQLGLWEFSTGRTATTDYRELVPIGPITQIRPDSTVPAATRRFEVDTALQQLRPGGNTGLYDTALAAYTQAQKAWQPGRLNLVVLLTDGRNEDGRGLSRAQLLSELQAKVDKKRPVQLMTIAYGADASVAELQEISRVTGGRTFASKDPSDIEKVFLTVLFGR